MRKCKNCGGNGSYAYRSESGIEYPAVCNDCYGVGVVGVAQDDTLNRRIVAQCKRLGITYKQAQQDALARWAMECEIDRHRPTRAELDVMFPEKAVWDRQKAARSI